jgi:malonate-semialdehyde dehydrogenase (acetylating)/methylmalonate-semialdehyde dehydrogenase
VKNFVNGQFVDPPTSEAPVPVTNPATGEVFAQVPCTSEAGVAEAVKIAKEAQVKWQKQTIKTRVQSLFKLKHLMEENMDKLVTIVVEEHGKCKPEARASVMKGIETIEWACSLPQMAVGRFEEVSRGISCRDWREPLGVVVSIVPFNFPVMVPMWTIPIALGCGNAVILKPSEKVPMAMTFIASLMKQAGIPDGIFQTVNGTRSTCEALIDHPDVKAVTFVGTSTIAESVQRRANNLGKRALCLGGAKNHLAVLPDADIDMCTSDIMNSFAGMTGQRCMAASVLLMVGKMDPKFVEMLVAKAKALKAGQEAGEIGPLIEQASKDKVLRYINEAEKRDGAEVLVDGRSWADKKGYWVGPTILKHKSKTDAAIVDEIFGPVLSIYEVDTFDEAIAIENANPYGNAACIYTSVGQHADYFIERFQAAMCGVNIGVPVPREPFSFGGMNRSNFGISDITGEGCMDFMTLKKKVTQKWVPPTNMSVVDSAFIR